MSPAPNSEARKRAETTQPAALADDPVDRIRRIAKSLHDLDYVITSADLLDLAEEVVPRPPTVSEIIDHVEAGGEIELCSVDSDEWVPAPLGSVFTNPAWWRTTLSRTRRDFLAHGVRLAPLPEPRTERVPLHEVVGRTLPGETDPVHSVVCSATGDRATVGSELGQMWITLPVADDGTVEVLAEDDQ